MNSHNTIQLYKFAYIRVHNIINIVHVWYLYQYIKKSIVRGVGWLHWKYMANKITINESHQHAADAASHRPSRLLKTMARVCVCVIGVRCWWVHHMLNTHTHRVYVYKIVYNNIRLKQVNEQHFFIRISHVYIKRILLIIKKKNAHKCQWRK